MIRVIVAGTQVYSSTETPITSGTVGRKVSFTFDDRWNGLLKTAVFKCGNISVDVYLGKADECDLPWEILLKENVGKMVIIGVCGLRDEQVVYPTIYTNVDRLMEGTAITGEPSGPHTPDYIQQLIIIAGRAEQVAVHPPIIGENRHWFCWDIETGEYVDSGIFVGDSGATFTPSVDAESNLSWTNDKGLKNPETVNIKGDKGEKPVCGVDYFTEADKTEIVGRVLAALPDGEEMVF